MGKQTAETRVPFSINSVSKLTGRIRNIDMPVSQNLKIAFLFAAPLVTETD